MTDFEAKVMIMAGWLENKYSAMSKADVTAKEAFKIANECVRLARAYENGDTNVT